MIRKAKRKPYKQRWKGGIPPTEQAIEAGREGFRQRGILEELEGLASEAGLYPLFTGPRTAGAATTPRCYLYFSQDAKERGEENLACIGGDAQNYQVIVRPLGRNKNRVNLVPSKYDRHLIDINTEVPGWRHLIVRSEADRDMALGMLRDIRIEYAARFDV